MTRARLYNYTMSICSMKTRLAMEEFSQPYDDVQVDIGFALENFEPDYVRLNPLCVVPTMVLDGRVITDSARIVIEVARNTGVGLPLAPHDRALALDWFDRGNAVNFQVITYARSGVPRGDELLSARLERTREYAQRFPDLRKIYEAAHARVAEHAQLSVHPQVTAAAEADLVAKLDLLDIQVTHTAFIGGTGYSVADVMWTVLLARIEMLGLADLISSRARLLDYYQRAKARPSFAAARVMPNWQGGI